MEEKIEAFLLFEDNEQQKMNKDEHFEKNDTKRYSQEFNSNNDSILDHVYNVKQLESKQNENITDYENKENNLHGSLNHIGEKDANNIENQKQERDISCSNSTINESKESGRNDFERQSNYKSVFSKFLELISRYESPMNQSEPWELPSADITNDKFKENNVHKILSQVNQNDSINSLDQTEKSGTFNAVIQHINKDGYFENHDAKKNSLGLNSNDDIFDYFDNIKPQESKRKENITDNENKENNLHDSLNHTDEKDANNIENQTKERGISCSISTINESNENGRNDFEQSNYSSASKKALELLSRYEFSMNQSKPWELLGADITNDEFKENNVHKNLSQVNQNDSINSLDQTEKSGTFNAVIRPINKDGYFENHDARTNSLELNSNDDIFDHFDNIKPQESKRNENITDNENKENNLHGSLFRNESCMNQPKPWELPGADITDWFNYGLNEETWKAYFNRHVRMRKEASNECNRTENNTSSNLKQIKIQKTNSGSYPYYQQQSNTSRNFDRTRPTSNYGQFHNYYELSEQNAASTWNSNYCHDSFLMNNDQSYFQAYVASQCSSYNYNSDSAQTNSYNSYKPIQSNSYNYNYETMQSDSHKNYETVQCNFYNYSFGTAQVNPHNSFEATKSNSYNYNYETARSSFHDSSEATQSNSYNYNSETSRSSSHDSFEATKSNSYNYNYETARSNFHDGFEATQSNSYNYNSETSRSSFHDSSEATKFNSYNYNYEIARSGWERDYVGVSSRSFNSKLATVYKKEE